jgi:hypothetical protein
MKVRINNIECRFSQGRYEIVKWSPNGYYNKQEEYLADGWELDGGFFRRNNVSIQASRLRREQAEAEAGRHRARHYYEEELGDGEEPEFHIVRGPDGRLYRVRNPSYQEAKKHTCMGGRRELEPRIVRGADGKLYRVDDYRTPPTPQSPNPADTSSDEEENNSASCRNSPMRRNSFMEVDSDDEAEVQIQKITTKDKKSPKGKKSKRKKITVIVEDASDSEYEDEYKSPFRNRRPSPGQWMEPVEQFQ